MNVLVWLHPRWPGLVVAALIVLCWLLILASRSDPEYTGDMPGPQEALYVRHVSASAPILLYTTAAADTLLVRNVTIDTLRPGWAPGDTMWFCDYDGARLFPLGIMDSTGGWTPLCECWKEDAGSAPADTVWAARRDGTGRQAIAVIDAEGRFVPLRDWEVEGRCAVMGCNCLQTIWTGTEELQVEDYR